MASIQQRLENINQRSKRIVMGFIRLCYVMVPIDIINLCVLFYAICESFDKPGKDLYISDSENGLKNVIVEQKERIGAHSVFGSFVIDSEKLGNSVIEWTFKLYSTSIHPFHGLIMYIGIVDGAEDTITDLTKREGYALSCRAKYRNYGWRMVAQDGDEDTYQQSHTLEHTKAYSIKSVFKTDGDKLNMIQLTLNIPQRSLSLIVNDKQKSMDVIKKFENVDVTGLYRMALSMRYPGTKIEIVDFQILQQ